MSATVNGTRKMGSSVEIGNKAASSTAAANRDGTGTSVGSVNGFSFNKSNAAGDKLKKSVSIEESDTISPLMLGKSKTIEDGFSLDRPGQKQHRSGLSKRLHGRQPSYTTEISSTATSASIDGASDPSRYSQKVQGVHDVLGEVAAWMHDEKQKRHARKAKRKEKHQGHGHGRSQLTEMLRSVRHGRSETSSNDDVRSPTSSDSEDSVDLERLELILGRSLSDLTTEKADTRKQSIRSTRRSSMRRQRRYSSDIDTDVDAEPPSCDAYLDNAKTLDYFGGSSSTHADLGAAPASKQDRQAWLAFKYEIVRLAHTLKVKGWRQVAMEQSHEIDVERLSGALTNAVYVVAPPKDLGNRGGDAIGDSQPMPKKPPPKLLLRIYGPQVEHLIDRENELRILRRLARKRIGPRMLGTFTNGRFEEFFHARTLKPQDLRDADTSRQIAKRMRELHEGIELLDEERDAGPFVWRNWDSWLDRSEKIVMFIDDQITSKHSADDANTRMYKKRGYVCGTDWQLFKRTVERYRAWLDEQYGGADRLREQLVFAHNDTQYGNILRLEPPGESPLLHPANQHKQLVVIDFEYSSANMPGLEFANHFTEWCYNYHDAASFACHTTTYPTPEEQKRFLRAYVVHRPQYAPAAMMTPRLLPRELSFSSTSLPSAGASMPSVGYTNSVPISASSSNIARASATIVERPSLSSSYSNLTLDSRQPQSRTQSSYFDTENLTSEPSEAAANDEDELETEITGLMYEARLWRLANSAQWVAWGVVQAQVPGLEHSSTSQTSTPRAVAQLPAAADTELEAGRATDPLDAEAKEAAADMADKRPDEDEAEGFDYLSYARERALFFWGDALQFGFVTEEELEEFGLGVGERGKSGQIKIVEW